MARIRSIKPDFPQSESMGNVSRDARLAFVLLWTLADDSGRLRGNSRMLASLLFPYDDDAPKLIDGWLSELEQENCIFRYRAENQSYVQIANWLIHQKIDKPSPSKIPPFDESSRILANPRERSSLEGKGLEGIGEEGNGVDAPEQTEAPKKTKPDRSPNGSRLPHDWFPSEADAEYCQTERPDLDVKRVADDFRDYWHGKAGADARKADWPATWRGWVRRQNQPRGSPVPGRLGRAGQATALAAQQFLESAETHEN